MTIKTRKTSLAIAIAATALAAAAGGFVWAGVYDVGADAPHTRPVYAVLDTVRERSIAARAKELQPPPDLASAERIRQGAGNYQAMCSGCHLAPGMQATELSRGLYPAPPDFSKQTPDDPARAFWTIKHGIKASGMPAWGHSMGDDYIWNMAALLQALPSMDEAKYRALVAESGGHSHGGGETMPEGAADRHGDPAAHGHDDGGHGNHEDGMQEDAAGSPLKNKAEAEAPAPTGHRHADGKSHEHAAPKQAQAVQPAKPAAAPPEPAAEEHDAHEHSH
ncbi:cytochrome c [Lysobacter sp. Root667]|uniref:c-type cytochrome n=1 Tax=Lysobacter sp. Root667 TaxID=1736581 RepID=UPI0009E6F06D|nr:cytochrome c [Lysobacter sp. Root667]